MAKFYLVALAAFLCGPALGQVGFDADTFCRKAGRNEAIFEMLQEQATVAVGKGEGGVTCSWTLSSADAPVGRSSYSIILESSLLPSRTAARQMILMARLPDNHRGFEITPFPNLGDDGLSRATLKEGRVMKFEVEAVKGRRQFLLTISPPRDGELTYRTTAASINFIGAIAALGEGLSN